MAELRALLGVPVDAFLHGVDVDECQGVRAAQRRLPGQLRQGTPGRPSPARLADHRIFRTSTKPALHAEKARRRHEGATQTEAAMVSPAFAGVVAALSVLPSVNLPCQIEGTALDSDIR
jgi:hypothetical protein